MKSKSIWLIPILGILVFAAFASAQMGEGRAIVTILPKKANQTAPAVQGNDIGVKVDGKQAKVTVWRQLNQPGDRIELVLLIDSAARTSLGTQLNDLEAFVRHLPPNTVANVGYMDYGRATFVGSFTADGNTLVNMLHLPAGPPGANASPYFSLSDLAKRWPSQDTNVRRIAVMITDGVEPYFSGIGIENPYVKTSMDDVARAGIVVYSIYWKDKGRLDQFTMAQDYGQNQLSALTESAGGRDLWTGFGDPVSFSPYFDDLMRMLRNQYELRFTVPLKKKADVENMRLKLSAPGSQVIAPVEVYITPTPVALENTK